MVFFLFLIEFICLNLSSQKITEKIINLSPYENKKHIKKFRDHVLYFSRLKLRITCRGMIYLKNMPILSADDSKQYLNKHFSDIITIFIQVSSNTTQKIYLKSFRCWSPPPLMIIKHCPFSKEQMCRVRLLSIHFCMFVCRAIPAQFVVCLTFI
jgi:hypothetical protein